jgi:hypothetical protein
VRKLSHSIFLAALTSVVALSSARAVTCDEVRALSASAMNSWAQRLQMAPSDLKALLNTAFCRSATQRERVVAKSRTPDATTAFGQARRGE